MSTLLYREDSRRDKKHGRLEANVPTEMTVDDAAKHQSFQYFV